MHCPLKKLNVLLFLNPPYKLNWKAKLLQYLKINVISAGKINIKTHIEHGKLRHLKKIQKASFKSLLRFTKTKTHHSLRLNCVIFKNK